MTTHLRAVALLALLLAVPAPHRAHEDRLSVPIVAPATGPLARRRAGRPRGGAGHPQSDCSAAKATQ